MSNRGKGKKATSSKSEPGEDDEDTKSRKSGKADQETADQINKDLAKLKYDVPEKCKINFAKNTRIEKLDGKFLLIAHPHPALEGELLILKPQKKDQESGEEDIVFRDYSLRKRIPAKDAPEGDKKSKDKKKKEKDESKLSCLEISIDEPINHQEW
jgi:hypothetical protein